MIKDSRKFDPKSDIWSVAITLIEMLTTRTPWAELEPGAVVYKIAYEPIAYQLPSSVPKSMRQTIELMHGTIPEKRPNASQLLQSEFFQMSRDAFKRQCQAR